ncbi:MAG: ADP-ribosylation factor-like protein [Candidatus Helarchaeota archaeon]
MSKSMFKIVFMGLDEAGKTSILLTLEGDYDPSKIKPTLGAERSEFSVLGFPIIRWDLGGQEQYRINYLQKRSRVLDDTDLLFYVIDLANRHRFDESLTYYTDILSYFREIGLLPQIVILLHKADPDFLKSSDCQESIKFLIDQFKECTMDFDIEFFITSIFNKKTLIDAFSKSVLRLFPKLSAIDTLLKTFIADADLDAALLFDENFFIIGNAYRDEVKIKDTVLQAINGIYFLFEDLVKVRCQGYELELNLRKIKGDLELQYLFRRVILGNWDLFVLLIGREIVEPNALIDILRRDYDALSPFF